MDDKKFDQLLKKYLKLQPFKKASNKKPFQKVNALHPKLDNTKKFLKVEKGLKENISNFSKQQLIKIESADVNPDIKKIARKKIIKQSNEKKI